MKNKIVLITLFLAIISMNLIYVSKIDINDLSLNDLIHATKVNAEELDFCSAMWTVKYTVENGHLTCSCTSGGSYKCPHCTQ